MSFDVSHFVIIAESIRRIAILDVGTSKTAMLCTFELQREEPGCN